MYKLSSQNRIETYPSLGPLREFKAQNLKFFKAQSFKIFFIN